ncbi:hypothetical protein [Aeromonas caviae]
MTSWVMWEIWWSRMWGGQEKARLRVDEEEVAHEPSRLPAELIAQRHTAGSCPPRPRG